MYSHILLSKTDAWFLFPYLENTGIWSHGSYLAIPSHFTGAHISVNVSGWWLLPFFRCYVLVVAGRWVSPNSEPMLRAAFPRPSSRKGSWTVHGFCSAVGSGEDKRLCVTEGWKEQVRNKGKIDDLPVEFCAWVVSQYFFVSLLHLRPHFRPYFKPKATYRYMVILEKTECKNWIWCNR